MVKILRIQFLFSLRWIFEIPTPKIILWSTSLTPIFMSLFSWGNLSIPANRASLVFPFFQTLKNKIIKCLLAFYLQFLRHFPIILCKLGFLSWEWKEWLHKTVRTDFTDSSIRSRHTAHEGSSVSWGSGIPAPSDEWSISTLPTYANWHLKLQNK